VISSAGLEVIEAFRESDHDDMVRALAGAVHDERLDGKRVVVTFTVGKPRFTWGEGKSLRTWAAHPRGPCRRTCGVVR
jgi:hypothetical protein